MERERTYTYQQPDATAGTARTLAGREFLERMARGEIPAAPVADTLGFELVEVGDGRVVFTGAPHPWQYNPIGTVHGGVLATYLDSAAACAVHSTLPAGGAYTTLEISVRYTRPVTADTGVLTAIGEVVTRGRTVATAAARLEDADGRVLAHATSTCLLFPPASADQPK